MSEAWRRVILRKELPEHGVNEIVMIIYPDRVVLVVGPMGGLIATTFSIQEALKFAAEVQKDYPLDALSHIS